MDFFERPPVHLFDQPLSGRVESEISLNHQGRVICQGVSWKASLYLNDYPYPLMPDQVVDVIGREGNTLLILPESEQEYVDQPKMVFGAGGDRIQGSTQRNIIRSWGRGPQVSQIPSNVLML